MTRKTAYVFSMVIVFGLLFGCATLGPDRVDVVNTMDPAPLEQMVFGQGSQIKEDVDLLCLLELGTIYSIRGEFKNSNIVLEEAYKRYTAREEEAILGARKVGAEALDVFFGEGSREYELADYEKVYLHTIKAMNYLMLGNVDDARVETMRGIERHKKIREYTEFESAQVEMEKGEIEAQIEDVRAAIAEQEADPKRAHRIDKRKTACYAPYDLEKNLQDATAKAQLPMELKRAVAKVRNAYENSYTYLLAALNFSLCGEQYNAEPQLKNAYALSENHCLNNILADAGNNNPDTLQGRNVYVFAQVGRAPVKENLIIPFPNPLSETVCQFSIARIKPSPNHINSIEISNPGTGRTGRLEMLTNMELLPLKEYEEKLPEKLTKAVLRVLLQTLRDAGVVGLVDDEDKFMKRLVQAGLSFLNISVAKADTRTWSTVPKSVLFYSGKVNGSQLRLHIRDDSGHVVAEDVTIDPNKVNLINVRCFDNQSYVHSVALAASTSAGSTRPEVSDPDDLGRLTISASGGGNIREQPTTDSQIVVALPQGTEITVLGKQGRWYQVIAPSGRKAWAHESLFGSKPEAEKWDYGHIEGLEHLTVTSSSGGNMREDPTTASRIVVSLPQGVKVGMLGKEGQWYQVMTPTGHKAWAHESLFHQVSETASSPESQPDILSTQAIEGESGGAGQTADDPVPVGSAKDDKPSESRSPPTEVRKAQETTDTAGEKPVHGATDSPPGIIPGTADAKPDEQGDVPETTETRDLPETKRDKPVDISSGPRDTPEIAPPPSPVTAHEPIELQPGHYIRVLESEPAGFLEEPDVFSKVIGSIPGGTRLPYIEKTKGYYLIEYESKKGYVYKSFCEEVE
jgi:uncharacterized protein YgiM (DUF1202 family)